MATFSDFLANDRRLVLLRGLRVSAQYRSNSLLLGRYCDSVGHAVSGDRIEQDLAWLQEQGLVGVEQREGLTIATLTPRGRDVAEGRTVVPGVQQPQPGT